MTIPSELLVLPYEGTEPRFGGAPRCLGPRAAVLGRATIGKGLVLGEGAVIRADGHFVEIGDDFHLGPRATVHIAHAVYPTIIGDRVSVGINAVVHACTVGSDCVIDDNVVVLDGSVLEDGVALAPDSVVFPRSKLEGGFLYAGMPAKPVRPLEAGEVARLREAIRCKAGPGAPEGAGRRADLDITVFLAATARIAGSIRAAPNSSVWFGCELDAGDSEIVIGENANIQDNTRISCAASGFRIGRNSTIGHNVLLHDCTIGENSLAGIGAVIAGGTVVEDSVLVAAGAVTEPGQVLESGWLWGGRPARAIARLDERKIELISTTAVTYCQYAQRFKAIQERRRGEKVG